MQRYRLRQMAAALVATACAVAVIMAVQVDQNVQTHADASLSTVRSLLETVSTARSAFHLKDSAGHSMDTLKVVPDPTTPGRYLGVYHWLAGTTFNVGVATSTDLKTWTYRRTLDTNGSQPYLGFTPAPKNGPLLALETQSPNHLRFKYWTGVAGMLGTTAPYVVFDAPKTLSQCAEGTPNIRAVTYADSTSTITNGSTVVVGHHYFQNCATDRQALGTLTNFSSWNTAARPDVDAALVSAGAAGKHGDRDRFFDQGSAYELYEGTVDTSFSFADWRNYLWDGSTAVQLNIHTPGGSTAFANPSVTVMNDPNGVQSVVVTQFIPSEGSASGEGGELIYWNPVGTPTATTPPPTTTTPPPTTPPPTTPPPTGSVLVGAAGDISNNNSTDVATANRIIARNPAAVLTLGDNQYPSGSLSDYLNDYDKSWGAFKSKTYPVPGNHEYGTSGASGYFNYFGSRAPAPYYAFTLGDWRLFAMNSEVSFSTQTTWLRDGLAADNHTCELAYWHKPRYSSSTSHGSNSTYDPWFDLAANSGVDLILNGHVHDYERFAQMNASGAASASGVREIVAGTGGAELYGFGTPIANSQVRVKENGVLFLTLNASSYSWEFVNTAGTVRDSGTTACH